MDADHMLYVYKQTYIEIRLYKAMCTFATALLIIAFASGR